jgi:hypothetical protein
MNIGSRVNRAGFTNRQAVPVRAIPSAGFGDPAYSLAGPCRVVDCAGKPTVMDHSSDVQVFDDEPVVGLD